MLQKMIDDTRSAMRATARVSALAAATAIAAFVALSFLSAAAFLFVLERYGPVAACLSDAGFFCVVALALLLCLNASRRRTRPKEVAKSAIQEALADPMVIVAGLQLVRAIGVKRLVPIAAIAGVAFGLMAKSRDAANEEASNQARVAD